MGKVYVSTILGVHRKYNNLVMTAFNNDSGFVAALDKACGKFINNNAVTRLAAQSSKSPELLAKYCDLLLKKSSKNPEEAELEDTLNQVMVVFKYMYCRLVLGHFNNHAFSHFPLNWNAVYIVLLVFMVASIREGNSTGSTICQKANSSQTASKTGTLYKPPHFKWPFCCDTTRLIVGQLAI